MGDIRQEVSAGHLRSFPQERDLITPFSLEFDVTWAARRTAYRTHYSVYLLRPEDDISRIFGFNLEIALFVFDYDPMEARTIQAINQALQESPLAGRADPSIYIVLGRGERTNEWVANYALRNPDPRTAVALSFSKVKTINNRFELRNTLSEILFRRDLFDDRLPIDNDLFFFGRGNVISKLRDQVRKGQNTGLFGLRKTGKTSILYKLRRDAHDLKYAQVVYLDCKNPVIRKKTARELIDYITRDVAEKSGIALSRLKKGDEYERFTEVVRLSTKSKSLCLIFDEVEYISPVAKLDKHWHLDFLDLWQLIWSTQSVYSGLCFVIGGVNAGVCELPTYHGVQNPLFSIVNIDYLKGFDSASLSRMLTFFGSQMGLHFKPDAIGALEEHYGGHPLLTRLACSMIHTDHEKSQTARPFSINGDDIRAALPDCDTKIAAYCTHIVSELKEFYPDEYEVLMMASVGQKSEFIEYGHDSELTKHLLSYGILAISNSGQPIISLPVLQTFLSRDYSRTSGTRIPRELVNKSKRENWVKQISDRIARDLRGVLQSIPKSSPSPFGARGVPDLDIWTNVAVVSSRAEFEGFISICYKVMYENVVRHMPQQHDFEGWFKGEWPAFYDSLRRIKCYRDFTHHIDVSETTRKRFDAYLIVDLGGRDPDSVPEGWFAMQQAVLDELLYAIQVEASSRAA